ncbi:hypothetical protein EX30DRAFT_273250 [Ascodesmis nigricans]|uniref:Uncharacterized protein n=1 Tax=Ascodesmis nigricans TaxID=341454 RepID=A0A4S2MXE9_9PEZI|nr:hypothetical protein EX30DRAFT_273250 [Ascodesmis nigricans]
MTCVASSLSGEKSINACYVGFPTHWSIPVVRGEIPRSKTQITPTATPPSHDGPGEPYNHCGFQFCGGLTGRGERKAKRCDSREWMPKLHSSALIFVRRAVSGAVDDGAPTFGFFFFFMRLKGMRCVLLLSWVDNTSMGRLVSRYKLGWRSNKILLNFIIQLLSSASTSPYTPPSPPNLPFSLSLSLSLSLCPHLFLHHPSLPAIPQHTRHIPRIPTPPTPLIHQLIHLFTRPTHPHQP